MSKKSIAIFLLVLLLPSIYWIPPAQAQGGGWSGPYRLSSEAGTASEGYLVADQYGYVHCFWTETLFEDESTVIKYTRFDGATWTKPNDIYVTGLEVRNISPFVDQQGILYLAWAEGQSGSIYYNYRYTYAPANNAVSSQSWASPLQTTVPARNAYFRVDSEGIFHILYINQSEETGVYYIRSEDKGITWSGPVWLDPDILPDHIPDSLNFEIDENDGLHAVWWYGGLNRSRPDWVRYTHSLDGGYTWSDPLNLDQYNEENGHNLSSASPRMIVQGTTVHVIWAAGSLPYRYHCFSTDAGRTWSAPAQVFGQLHGQAFDGLAVDAAGRVHFFGQIRYPLAIYHAYWDQNRWSNPSIVYFIAEENFEEGGHRVHAHDTIPIIRAGNQLVLTFSDPPSDSVRRLFVMYRTLDDVSPLESAPTPILTSTPVPNSTPTPMPPTLMPSPTAKSALLLQTTNAQPVGPISGPDLAVRVALVPAVLIIAVTMIVQLFKRRR